MGDIRKANKINMLVTLVCVYNKQPNDELVKSVQKQNELKIPNF